jgi:hypothetical protein
MTLPEDLARLVSNYLLNEQDYNSTSFNEAQLRQQYLDPFFEFLGWDVSNRQGYSEEYKEVIHEDSILVEGSKKAPDYCFKIGRERKFFVEAKKPGVDIRVDKPSAYQLRRYAWSAQMPYSLLTNFKYFAIYDTRNKPAADDHATNSRIAIYEINKISDWWEKFEDQFSKNKILRGGFQRALGQTSRTGSTTVDIKFLEEIELWRHLLASDLRNKNRQLSAEQLNTITQLTIDRILFLRICEDRGIEPLGQLKNRTSGKKKYEQLLTIFEGAQKRYNSGLFHIKAEPRQKHPQDELSRTALIGDEVLNNIIGSLYFPECPYEFSVFPPDMLGQVYEKFLGSQISFSGLRGIKVELKPEVKKSGGVYYTPTHIVHYIVEKSLSPLLTGSSSKDRPKLAVLDMACGSGTFLIEAYDFLLQWYLKWHSSNPKSKGVVKVPRKDGKGFDLRLTIEERKRILIDHIYGVDIDEHAVEVARLSLLMKVVEDSAVIPRQMEIGELRSPLLPDLYENIVCGNSLIGLDVYDMENVSLDNDEEIKINAFDWASAQKFDKVLNKGGFDAVIGNPPYSYRSSTIEKLKPYYEQKFLVHQGNHDLYKYFLEKACSLLKKNGSLGQIVNASFLIQPQFEKLRQFLDVTLNFTEIDSMGSKVFPKVTIDTAIILAKKRSSMRRIASEYFDVREPSEPIMLRSSKVWTINQRRLSSTPAYAIDWRLDDVGYRLVQRLVTKLKCLQDFCELSVGINTGSMKDKMVFQTNVNNTLHPCVRGTGLKRYGDVTTTGWIAYDVALVRAAGKAGRSLPPEKFFNNPKLLVVRTRNVSLQRRIIATIDTNNYYNLNRLSNILPMAGVDIYTILGFLNSQLVNWLFQTRFFNYEIKPVFLKELPIPTGLDSTLSSLVKQRLSLSVTAGSAPQSQQDHSRNERKIQVLEHMIESRVRKLYEITPEELSIFQNTPLLENDLESAEESDSDSEFNNDD